MKREILSGFSEWVFMVTITIEQERYVSCMLTSQKIDTGISFGKNEEILRKHH